MNILAVDDEPLVLRGMEKELNAVFPGEAVHTELDAFDALEWAEKLAADGGRLDYAFLDIQLRGIDGLELARRLKRSHPKLALFFCTGYSEHAIDAYGMCAKGYLLKPVQAEQIVWVLDEMIPDWRDTENPLPMDVRVQTFGNFEVFVNGAPLAFEREKAKEVLAYLVDRHGASVTTEQLAAVLWEDRPCDRKLRNIVSTVSASLKKTLDAAGVGDILVKRWGHLAVDPQKFKCDAYDFEKWDMTAVNAFHGEYMAGYSWAEFTAGEYVRMEQENRKKLFFF